MKEFKGNPPLKPPKMKEEGPSQGLKEMRIKKKGKKKKFLPGK